MCIQQKCKITLTMIAAITSSCCFFYHDNSQNIFMAHLYRQHAQSLTRAICRTDTRQKSILFIQEPNFNPISIGGGMGYRPSDFMESHYSVAPCCIRISAISAFCASCNGVCPRLSRAITSAPCCIRILAISTS